MVTGKNLIELGYKPGKWFKEAIDYANQNELSGDGLIIMAGDWQIDAPWKVKAKKYNNRK